MDRSSASFSELAKLLRLKRAITEVTVYGRGGKAHVRIALDDGGYIVLDPLGSYLSPTKLASEIAAQAGAKPKLKGDDVLQVAKLIHDLGAHHAVVELEDQAAELGAEYLRRAVIGEVDIADQASRWSAFCELDRSLRTDLVLLDAKTDIRYVRVGWFAEFVRERGMPAPWVLRLMGACGWRRRGHEGLIKATDPMSSGSLAFRFFEVSDDAA